MRLSAVIPSVVPRVAIGLFSACCAALLYSQALGLFAFVLMPSYSPSEIAGPVIKDTMTYEIAWFDNESRARPSRNDREVVEACPPGGEASTGGDHASNKLRLSHAQASKFLSCSMSVSRDRFCNHSERLLLAENLNRYVVFRRAVVQDLNLDEASLAAINKSVLRDRTTALFGGSLVALVVDGAMRKSVWQLSRDGLLSHQDFRIRVGGTPQELMPFIAKKLNHLCD